MAQRVAKRMAEADLVHLRSSPLERAQETIAPLAESLGLPVVTDHRVTEAANHLQGQVVSMGTSVLRTPGNWQYFVNPVKPSWGEPYRDIVARMRLALRDAVAAAQGHEALIVSHQLPIYTARRDAEGQRLAHDPRRRECTLASLTSITFIEGRVASVSYSEPARDLLPAAVRQKRAAGA
jgi:broad specificity phosphatase PhoE